MKHTCETIVRRTALILAAALLVPCALCAKTTSVDIPATGGKWSTFTWSDGAPENGDTVILNNNNAAAVTIENDTADTLAKIITGGQSGITITGRDLTLTSADEASQIISGESYKYAISNGVPFVIDVPVTVSANQLWHFDNDLTLNRDVTVGDGLKLGLLRIKDNPQYALTFNGHLHATNAYLKARVYAKNKVVFNKSIHVKSNPVVGTDNCTDFYFYASGNTWTDDGTGNNKAQMYLYAENAFEPTRPFTFGDISYDCQYDRVVLHADQKISGLVSSSASSIGDNTGAQIQSLNNSTLYVCADESRTAYCQLGGDNSSSFDYNYKWDYKLNVNFSATSDDIVQTLAGRSHTMTGSLVVCSGTLRAAGKTRFKRLPDLTVRGGKFECASTATDTVFPALKRLHIAPSAVFKIDTANTATPFASGTTTLSVEAGGKIAVPSGKTASFKAAFYDGNLLGSGTYTASTCAWIEGDGSVVVSIPDNWNVWKTNTDGSWTDTSSWSKGAVPSADDVVVVIASKSDVTVSAEGMSTVPSQILLFGFNEKKAILRAGSSATLTDCNLVVGDGGIFSVPEGSSVFKADNAGFTIEDGGKVSVAGSFFGTNLSARITGKLSVTGSFAVTNKSTNLIKFYNGADIEIDGGLFSGTDADPVYSFHTKHRDITFTAKNDAVIDLPRGAGTTLKFYGKEFTLSDNSIFKGGMTLGNALDDVEDLTNVVNVIDHAKLDINENIIIGHHSYGGNRTVIMNISTDQPIHVPKDIAVGRICRAVLNIDGGHQLSFGRTSNGGLYGLSIPTGAGSEDRSKNASFGGGEVNIFNGSISCTSCEQHANYLPGFNIACWGARPLAEQNTQLSGVMNVYKDGVVRIDIDANQRARSHFVVGSGLLADGKVNVYGGKIISNSDFNPLVGQWAGKGAINVYDDGYVYMKETMYVGGSVTNDLDSFKLGGSGNGGSKFAQYFPLDNTTGEGVINVEDGTFVVASNAVFSAAGTGSLAIGTNGLFVAKNVCLSNSVNSADLSENVSTLTVKFGSTSAGHVVCGTADETGAVTAIDGTLTVGKGAKLVVDASDLTSPASRYIPLVQFAELEGEFEEENIELIRPPKGAAAWCVVCTVRRGVDGYYLNAPKGGLTLIVR